MEIEVRKPQTHGEHCSSVRVGSCTSSSRSLAPSSLISLPSTGVIGVRPLLESPVELAGLLPRKPRPYPVPANGLGGEDAYAARDAVRDRVFEGFSVTGEC